MIRSVTTDDALRIAEIYNHYVNNTVITFEEEPISSDEIASRIAQTMASGLPWLVFESGNQVAGYANASVWRKRIAYRFTVESAIYVDHAMSGNGIGTRLYDELIENLRSAQFHTVIAGISLPNPTSIRLHERLGFTKIAEYSQVGRKFDRWIDVGFWQLMLNPGPPHC